VGAAARGPQGHLVARRRGERVRQVVAQHGLLLVVVEEFFSVLAEGAAGQVGEAVGDPLGQQGHLQVGGRREGDKGERASSGRRGHEQPIRDDAVGVGVEVERSAEALEEGDRSGLAVGEAQPPSAVALPGEDDPEEGADQLAEELRVAGEGEAEPEGEAEHPLAVGDRGQQVVDEVSCGVVGPAGRAARAEPALAGVGDEPLEAAVGAAEPGEAAAEQPAVQVVPKFLFDEAGIAGSSIQPRPGEEGLDVLTDDGVENGLFGLVATVLPR